MATPRPASPRRTLTLACAALALAGCAAPAPDAWRVAPSYRVTHALPGMASGYAALARQYEGEHRWSDALQAWRRAAVHDPDNVDVLNALGIALAGQGQLDDAIATLRRAAALAPQRAGVLNNLGFALTLASRHDEARVVLRQALALEPHHALARANLERIDPAAAAPQATQVEAVAAAPKRLEAPVAQAAAPAAEVSVQPLRPMPTFAPQPLPPQPVPTQERQAQSAEPEAVPQRMPLATALPAELPANLRVEIANGNGVTGMAAWLGGWLQQRGLEQRARLSNLRPYATPSTVVHFRDGYATQAREIARRMPRTVTVASQPGGVTRGDVRIVLGHDLRHLAACLPDCRDDTTDDANAEFARGQAVSAGLIAYAF